MEFDFDESELPLFPLNAVLFPGGLVGLKVFEARYLDLVADCLRDRQPFGIVALRSGSDIRKSGETVSFEQVGTLAEILTADSQQAGILQVHCSGSRRFTIASSRQRADGLWLARADPIEDDEPIAPAASTLESVRALAATIGSLKAKVPFLEPHRFDDAGWVANRWCEVLPISLAAKQKLMELTDPNIRLQLVDDFLRSKGVVR